MTSSWLEAILFSLAAGLVWGFYKEFSDTRKPAGQGEPRGFNPLRAVLFGLAGAGACLVGLALLTMLGLTRLDRG